MKGVSPTAGPPPGFPVRGVPSPMDVSLVPQSYNLLARAGVGRGLWPQSVPGSARPRAPGTTGLHQEQPPATHQLAAALGSHKVTPATPYQQAVQLPQQVRFAPPVTKAKTATGSSQSQSVATREGDSLGSMEVTRNQLLTPEQGGTGPPPEDLESEEGLPVKTQWMTSWTSYPQVGEGT